MKLVDKLDKCLKEQKKIQKEMEKKLQLDVVKPTKFCYGYRVKVVNDPDVEVVKTELKGTLKPRIVEYNHTWGRSVLFCVDHKDAEKIARGILKLLEKEE